MGILISIITVSKNSEKTIGRCIESVLSQDYGEIEYIIIDGASTDSTCEICRSYGEKIDCFISEKDNGIYSAWNKGIKNAHGDYIYILNSDDKIFNSETIKKIVVEIENKNRPPVIYGKVLSIEENTGYTFIDGGKIILRNLIYNTEFRCSASFVRKDVYEYIGGYNEKYKISSDFEWIVKLVRTYPLNEIVFIDQIVTKFYLGGISNQNFQLGYNEVNEIVKDYFSRDDYRKRWLFIQYRMFLKKILCLMNILGILNVWRSIKHFKTNHVGLSKKENRTCQNI